MQAKALGWLGLVASMEYFVDANSQVTPDYVRTGFSEATHLSHIIIMITKLYFFLAWDG